MVLNVIQAILSVALALCLLFGVHKTKTKESHPFEIRYVSYTTQYKENKYENVQLVIHDNLSGFDYPIGISDDETGKGQLLFSIDKKGKEPADNDYVFAQHLPYGIAK